MSNCNYILNKRFPLIQYSAAALALLSAKASYSQAVYTDIDPDVILDEPGESFGIDLDDDGLNDFNFFNKSFTTTVWYGDIGEVKVLYAGAFDNEANGIIGQTAYFSGYGGYTYYLPVPLESDIVIDSIASFHNANYQTLANEIYKPEFPPTTGHFGYWYPWFGENISYKYLGIKFTNDANINRYGWIRCSVIDSGRTLIIHDYAYESKPDTPILTGDTIGDTTTVSIEEGELFGLTVYSFGNTVFINTNSDNVEYSIYNMQGAEIKRRKLPTGNSQIELNSYRTGVYLVECQQENLRKTFKVFIEN